MNKTKFTKISGKEFKELFIKNNGIISNYIVHVQEFLMINVEECEDEIKSIEISSCKFVSRGEEIKIVGKKDNKLRYIAFINNNINDVKISFSNLKTLYFELIGIKMLFDFKIERCTIDRLVVDNKGIINKRDYHSTILLRENYINGYIQIKNFKFSNGSIFSERNKFAKDGIKEDYSIGNMIENSELDVLYSFDDKLYRKIHLKNNKIKHTRFIKTCFNEPVDILSNTIEDIDVLDCIYLKEVSFSKNKTKNVKIVNCKFKNDCYFQNAILDVIRLNSNKFEKNAYFDGLEINLLEKCNVETLSSITQQLKKSGNMLEYKKFKLLEFGAYTGIYEFEKGDKFLLYLFDKVSKYIKK